MSDCCEGDSAFENVQLSDIEDEKDYSELPKNVAERNMNCVEFSAMSPAERQAWVDFCAHEIERHQSDIERTTKELEYIKGRYGIEPRNIYLATWVEVYK